MGDEEVSPGTSRDREGEEVQRGGGYGLFSRRISLILTTNVLAALCGLAILPMVTRSLPADEYGIWVQVVVTVTLMPLFVGLGLPGAMVRFLAAERDPARVREGFYSVLAVVSVLSGAASVAIAALAGPISDALFGGRVEVVRLLALAVLFECVNSVPFNYLRTFRRIKRYSLYILFQSVLLVGLLGVALALGSGLPGIIVALVLSRAATTVGMLSPIVKELGPHRVTFSRLRKFMSFGVPLVPFDVSDWALSSMDRYLIGLMMGLAPVGYYSPGYSIAIIILMLASPLRFLLPAVLSEMYDSGRIEQVRRYLSYSIKYFLALALPAVVGMGVLSRRLLLLLTTEEIAGEGYRLVPVLATAMALYGLQVILGQVLILEKRTRVIGGAMSLAALVNLGLNVALIPVLGIVGAAVTTLVSYGLSLLVTAVYSLAHLRLDVDLVAIAKCAMASAVVGVVIHLVSMGLPEAGVVATAITVGVGVLAYVALVIATGVLSRGEIALLRGLIAHPFRRS